MKAPLSEFLMEDWLEQHRFASRYNAGESGHATQSLAAVLAGLQPDFEFNLRDALCETPLCDAPNMGDAQLRAAVARLHAGATAENVLITTGTSEALLLLLRQLRPAKVAVIVPAFQLLTEIPRSLDAEIIPLLLEWDERGIPHAPVESWVAQILREKPDVFIFNHPHNPSGLVFNESERRLLLDACDSANCTVIGDEHYRFLAASEGVGPTLWETGKRRFVTGSFIKCSGTPGLRIGWCVGEPITLAAMQSEKNYLTHTVNPLSQTLALWFLQSLERSQSFFAPLRSDWRENRRSLEQWLGSNPRWKGCAPQGGLVSCLFAKDALPPETHFCDLRERGIFLLPLSSFAETGMNDSAFLRGFRIGLGLRPSQFREMLSVMVR